MSRSIPARLAALLLASLLALLPVLTASAAAPAHAPAAAPAQEIDEALVGVFESDLLPSDDSDGLIITVSLFDDGSMEALSDFQNGTVVLELGTWYANGDGTITIVVEGTVDAPYDAPTELVFEVDGDDTLVNADLTVFGEDGLILYATGDAPVSIIEEVTAQMEEEAADEEAAEEEAATEEEAASEEEAVVEQEVVVTAADDLPGLYISNEIDADGTPAAVMVYLNEDGTVETVAMNFQVGGVVPISRSGVWEEGDDGSVTITLEAELVTDADGVVSAEPLDDTEAVTFTNDEGLLQSELFTLIPVDEIEAMIPSLAPEAAAEGGLAEDEAATEDEAPAEDEAAVEEEAAAEDEAAAEEEAPAFETQMFMSSMDLIMEGNIVVLLLLDDGTATLSAQTSADAESVVEYGTWEFDDDGNLVLTMAFDADDQPYDEPFILVFEQTTETTLTAIDYDAERYGEGLVLEMSAEE